MRPVINDIATINLLAVDIHRDPNNNVLNVTMSVLKLALTQKYMLVVILMTERDL